MKMARIYDATDTATDRPSTALDQARDALNSAIDLAARAQQIEDRLLGQTPMKQPENQALKTVTSGVLNDLANLSDRARSAVAAGMDALSRIDRAI
jgi:hypothetical protein